MCIIILMDKKAHLFPLYLTQALRRFSISLLSLFSAIYLYKSLGSLRLVFLFFLIFHLVKLLVSFLAEEWSLKLGLKKLVLFGQLLMILVLSFFFLSIKYPLSVFLASISWGIASGFYWFGRHGLMAKIGHLGEYGRALGRQEIFDLTPVLLSPILGGILISFFGYRALFAVSLLFIILSLFTLGSIPEERIHHDTSLVEILKLFKTHKRMFLAYFGDSAAATIYVISFPLYLFLILGRELSIGKFFSLSLIIVAIFNFLIGKFVDLKGKKELIAFGSLFSFLIWIGRLVARTVGFLFFLDVFDRVVEKMTSIPLDVLTYEKALDGHATGRAILFRGTAAILGSFFSTFCLLIVRSLSFSFVLAAGLTLFPLLIVKKRGVYGDGVKRV